MAKPKTANVHRGIRTLFSVERFGTCRTANSLNGSQPMPSEAAELAFAALVERHGPMVLRVCRGVLGDQHEAQDAFQATFLVLVRAAGSGCETRWAPGSIKSPAARHRRPDRPARRRRLRSDAARRAEEDPARTGDDLGACCTRRSTGFPSVSAPVVLCDLEGAPRAGGRRLGCPIGTVKSRLARGGTPSASGSSTAA